MKDIVIAVAWVLLLGSLPAFAQSNPNEEQGLKPYDSLQGGDLDSVSMTNGGLVLHIPLASFPQRGNLDLSFTVRFSSKQWRRFVPPAPHASAIWALAPNNGTQIVSSVDWWMQSSSSTDTPPVWSRSVTSPDGNTHQFAVNSVVAYPLRSLDATGLLHLDTHTLILPNGTRYNYPNLADDTNTGPGNLSTFLQGVQAAAVTDANGNQISIGASGWTDTLGRFIPGSSPGTGLPVQPGVPTSDLSACPSGTISALVWNVPGVAGGTRPFKFCYSNVAISTQFNVPGTTDASGNVSLLTAIVLPDLTLWTFAYDNYASVSRIGFPTGGSISYTYAFGPTNTFSSSDRSRWVISRTVDANDGTGGHTWTYSYTALPNPNPNLTPSFSNAGLAVVTSPDGNDIAYSIATPVSGSCTGYVVQTQHYQGSQASGTLLKTEQSQYRGNAFPGGCAAVTVVPNQSTVILPGGQTSKTTIAYDPAGTNPDNVSVIVGSVLQKDEYDFSNTLVRSTLNHYLWQDNATYKNNNLVGLMVSSTVKDVAGNQVAQTTYGYDEYAPGQPAGSGITTGLVSPPAGGTIRGNTTTVGHWLNTTSSFISSTAMYFDTGMKASSTDPLGHITSYSYSSNFAGAYVTQTNMPDTQMPDSGAAIVHHVISGNYDFNTGLLTSFTDENSQAYTYQYDIMLRLAQGNHPDGGKTLFSYPNPTLVERQRLISGSVYDDYNVSFDGLGRTVQTQHSTPSGTILTDTTYDAVGRASSVSNPYYQGSSHGSDPTYGITTTQYDALNRATKTIKQDGSFSTVAYNDNCTTATDEAGNQRKVCRDALGRMVEVDEPGNAYAGTASNGSFTIAGTLQSTTTGGTSASGSTGSVTIAPASGSDRSTQTGHGSTAGTGSVTITGTEQKTFGNCIRGHCLTIWDTGVVYVTVNGHQDSLTYGQNDTASTVAGGLATAINADSAASVTATASGSTVNLTAKTAGASTNYSLSSTSGTSDPSDFSGASFTPSISGSNLTNGSDSTITTVYDAGTLIITVNGHSDQVSFGQNDTANAIASRLVTAINGDGAAFVTASVSGNVVNLASKTTGATANVSLLSSYTYDTTHWSSAFFTPSNSGSALTGGANAVGGTPVYDSGTVSVSVGGFSTNVPYGQSGNSTAAQVASAVAAALNAGTSPVTASASGSMVSLTYKTVGVAGNAAVTVSSSTSQSQYFSGPSFTSSGTAMTGGSDPHLGLLSNPYVTLYQYDTLNNMLCVHQKGTDTTADKTCNDATVPSTWRPRVFTYDSLSRLLTTKNPESGTIGYAYDYNGNVVSKTAPAPNQTGSATVTTTYIYDNLDRLTDKNYNDGATPTASFRYDYASYQGQTLQNTVGRLMAATAGSGNSYLTSYDVMGRIKQTTQCISGVTACQSFSTGYDQMGNLLTLGYPGAQFTVTYGYDTAARLTSVTDSSGVVYAQTPTLLAGGAIQEFVSPNFNNNKFHADYNSRLQPTEIWAGSAQGASALFDKKYSYNAPNTSQMNNGNVYTVTNVKDDSRTQSFTYDALNRLLSAGDRMHWSNTYVYDAWGNLYQKNPGSPAGESLVKIADTGNRLSGMSYDAAGNVINDGNGNSFVYDAENRIISATSNGTTITNTYDAGGRRVKKSSGTNYWYGPGGAILAETDVSGNFTNYIFFAGQRLARNIPQPLPNPADIKYYITDHLHSTAMFVDQAGTQAAILDDNDFYPWGGILPGVGTTTSNNHYKFTGKERDAESGLDYFGARFYANVTGRFMSPDWAAKPTHVPYAELVDPQSLNLYSYVKNRPTMLMDPDGHDDTQTETKSEINGSVTNSVGLTTVFIETTTTTTTTTTNADGTQTTTTSQTKSYDAINITASGQVAGGKEVFDPTPHSSNPNSPTKSTSLNAQQATAIAQKVVTNLIQMQQRAGAPPNALHYALQGAMEHPGLYLLGAAEIATGTLALHKLSFESVLGFGIGVIGGFHTISGAVDESSDPKLNNSMGCQLDPGSCDWNWVLNSPANRPVLR